MTVGLDPARPDEGEFDLDITFAESDVGLAELLRLTDDGCGSTCQSACTASCP